MLSPQSIQWSVPDSEPQLPAVEVKEDCGVRGFFMSPHQGLLLRNCLLCLHTLSTTTVHPIPSHFISHSNNNFKKLQTHSNNSNKCTQSAVERSVTDISPWCTVEPSATKALHKLLLRLQDTEGGMVFRSTSISKSYCTVVVSRTRPVMQRRSTL